MKITTTAVLLALWAAPLPAAHTALFRDPGSRPAGFAASEIRRELAAAGSTLEERKLDEVGQTAASQSIAIAAGPAACALLVKRLGVRPAAGTSPQSYSIRRAANGTIAVLGAGEPGAMYGGLEIAELIGLKALAGVTDADVSPHIERRGIKFNIPLDARTPSYSDNSDAAQKNIPEMWSFDFWREFLDHMARHRYNVLTLWSLNPFPSIVKTPEFPDVALDDVQRTLVPMDETFTHSGSDMARPGVLAKLETVKKIAMGEKIRFWRDVMQYARDRGIEVYWFTWNIFTFGAQGKYGITPEQTNPKTIEYFRASVRETVLAYPLLAGMGITAGEQMQERKDGFSKEKWLWNTYGEGVRDALKFQPGREFRLIHRYHQTSQGEIFDAWKEYPGPFELSFKYSIAHMYSIPNPPYIKPVLENLPPGRKTWLTVRNDDIYSFRWGDAAYAREYIGHMPGPDKMAGFYMGPDGYNWGREFMSTEPETPREPVISKQWYSFLLWGRLSFDPRLSDGRLERIVAKRFPEVDAGPFMAAWAAASRVFPLVTRFFWGDIDLRWLPEACLSHPRHRGFYTVHDFVTGQTMPGSGVLNIVEWRKAVLAKQPAAGTTPPEIAAALEKTSAAAAEALPGLRARQRSNKELRLTLGDIEAMSHLGRYYAAKIRGAAELALFDRTGEEPRRAEAVRHLESALAHWQNYARAYTAQYAQPKLYNRVGWVDIPGLAAKVREDVAIAKSWKTGSVPDEQKRRSADQPFRK